jgi:hypothetical protein
MEPKRFMIDLKKGIAHALNNFKQSNTPPIANPWCLQNTFVKAMFSFHVLVWLCSTLLGSNKYVMEPKGFQMYPNRGIAQGLSSNYGHEQYPSDNLYQIFFAHGVYKIPS